MHYSKEKGFQFHQGGMLEELAPQLIVVQNVGFIYLTSRKLHWCQFVYIFL